MKNFIKEFKEFIARGNVLDMAIGVIIAGSFGKITTSLINDILMPFISYLIGARDMTALNVVIREPVLDEAGEVVKEAITLGFGTLLMTILDFVLVALVVFLIVKAFNKAKASAEAKKKAEEEAAAAAEPAAEPAPTAEELLTKILEELQKKQ